MSGLFEDLETLKRTRKPLPKVPENTRPYRPSNTTEGEYFKEDFCYYCKKWNKEKGCPIEMKTMFHDIKDKHYPKWWVEDLDGTNARCLIWAKK